jgi:sterol desaturase/sphingolipid hydroxylase (fatty acid hydroxylase superfamily)
MSLMVSARNHPTELALEPFTRVWPLALFSISPGYLLLINSVDIFYQYLVHIDARWSWAWFGRWILISPLAHRIHHSPLPEHFDKNFSTLVIWDRVFGTWYGGTTFNETVGIHESAVHNNGNLIGECILDVKQFLQALRVLSFSPRGDTKQARYTSAK